MEGSPNGRARRRPLWVVVALALVLGVGWFVLDPAGRDEDAAREVAAHHVDLVATADESDLEELLATTQTEDPGAMRTAGELLLRAEQRIEVVEVGEADEIDDWSVRVPVRYRLAGSEHDGSVELVKERDSMGGAAQDWHVSTPLTGTIGWDDLTPGDARVAEAYVGSVRQVRRAGAPTPISLEQPLYAAVYSTQIKRAPYYVAPSKSVTVRAGEKVAAPESHLRPTPSAHEVVRADVIDVIESCGVEDASRICPLFDVALLLDVPDAGGVDWFGGLVGTPTMRFEHDQVEIVRAVIEVRTPDGTERVTVSGHGTFVLHYDHHAPRVDLLEMSLA